LAFSSIIAFIFYTVVSRLEGIPENRYYKIHTTFTIAADTIMRGYLDHNLSAWLNGLGVGVYLV
jgi:hypothetical protein